MSKCNELLVQSAINGNKEAWGQIYADYHKYIRSLLRLKLNRADADDVCQEVFVTVMQKINQLREPKAFHGWLRTLTRNTMVSWLTKTTADKKHKEAYQQWTNYNELDTQDETVDYSGKLAEALQTLDPIHRETVERFYFKREPIAVLAERLNVPVGTIKSRLCIARERLRSVLVVA